MRCLLVRVGADQSGGGGSWNAPVDSATNEFVYVAIPESRTVRAGMEKPYSTLGPVLAKFGIALPDNLVQQNMHLGPDFDHLTYGDQGERASQLQQKLNGGDKIIFYSSLRDVRNRRQLVYAIIGVITIDNFVLATRVSDFEYDINAHSRRILPQNSNDIIVRGHPHYSGRLTRCIPIGEWRNGAYRVRSDILEAWGGLSVNDGWLQRSARLPEFLDPTRFLQWLELKNPSLIQANN
jgi:Nucleotide modification associated domain 3